jgi:hypothetical protein
MLRMYHPVMKVLKKLPSKKVALLKAKGLFLRAWEYHAIMRSHGGLAFK